MLNNQLKTVFILRTCQGYKFSKLTNLSQRYYKLIKTYFKASFTNNISFEINAELSLLFLQIMIFKTWCVCQYDTIRNSTKAQILNKRVPFNDYNYAPN